MRVFCDPLSTGLFIAISAVMDELRLLVAELRILEADDSAIRTISSEQELLLYRIKEAVDTNYKRPAGMYSVVRRLISSSMSQIGVILRAREILKQTQEEYKNSQAAQQKAVVDRNERQTVFTLRFVEEVVEKLIRRGAFTDKVLLLMLACGARKVEILDPDMSEFEEVFTFSSPMGIQLIKPFTICQKGLAKKRLAEKVKIEKPLLWINALEFMRILGEVRAFVWKHKCEHLNTAAAIKSMSPELERLSSALWPQAVANGVHTGTHINRAIYANVAYLEREKPGMSLTAFVKRVLGHAELGTACSYLHVSVASPTDRKLWLEGKKQEKAAITYVKLEGENGEKIKFRQLLGGSTKFNDAEKRAELADCIKQCTENSFHPSRSLLMRLGFSAKFLAKMNDPAVLAV